MSPEYFHTRLTYGEADDYLSGMNRRCRHGYTQARMITSLVGHLFAKNYKDQEFPWEKASPPPPPSEDEMRNLEQDAAAFEKMLNAKKG